MSDRTKVRSVLGWTEPTTEVTFPLMQGSGQAELLVLSTGGESIRFGATALSEGQPSPAGGLTEQEHGPAAARAYAIPVEPGPAAIRLFTLEDARVVGALRVRGPGEDSRHGGAVAASDAWMFLPAVSRALSTRAVLVNDGDADAWRPSAPPSGGRTASPRDRSRPPTRRPPCRRTSGGLRRGAVSAQRVVPSSRSPHPFVAPGAFARVWD